MCHIDEMMAIKVRKLEKKDTIRTHEPYVFHRLQITSGSLVVSWRSPCTITPWKMMDLPRECVA